MYIVVFFSSGLAKCDEHPCLVASYEYLIDDINCFKPGELSLSRSHMQV